MYIEVDLSGIEKESIEISATTDHAIKIVGTRNTDTSREYLRRERWTGQFERVIKLPEGIEVDVDRAAATHSQGVLSITVPKIVSVPEPQKTIIISQPASASIGRGFIYLYIIIGRYSAFLTGRCFKNIGWVNAELYLNIVATQTVV